MRIEIKLKDTPIAIDAPEGDIKEALDEAWRRDAQFYQLSMETLGRIVRERMGGIMKRADLLRKIELRKPKTS